MNKIIINNKQLKNFLIINIITVLIISTYLIVQNVGFIHEIFFPQIRTTINVQNNLKDWEKLNFNNNEYLKFDNIFFNKCIVNDANSDKDIVIRIKDTNNNILIDSLLISPGESAKLNKLKNNVNYIVEYKPVDGQVFINIA